MREYDICKKFTQREVNAKYFSNMLKYDPFNYSFAKTAQFVETDVLPKTFMCTKNYNAEIDLIDKIYEHWKLPLEFKDNIECPILETIKRSTGTIDIRIFPDTSFPLYTYTKWERLPSYSLSSLNGIKISPYKLLKVLFPTTLITGLNKDAVMDSFFNSNLFNAILTLSIALESKYSITKYLMYLYTEYKDNSLEDLITTKHVKENLKLKKPLNLKYFFSTIFNNTYIYPNLHSIIHWLSIPDLDLDMYNSWLGSSSVKVVGALSGDDSISSSILLSFIQYITFSIEILYHIFNMKDSTLQKELFTFLTENYESNPVNDCLYTIDRAGNITYPTEIEEIMGCDNNEERFIKIKNYIYNLDFNELFLYAKVFLKDYKTCITHHGVSAGLTKGLNTFLTMFVNYAHDISLHYIRIEYIKALEEYCKSNGIKLDKETITGGDCPESTEDDEDAYEEDEDDDDDEISSSGLDEPCNVDYGDTKSSGSKPRKSKIRDEMYDELDKANTSFKYGMYDYVVEDCYDSSDTYRDTYEGIASATKLLNKNLIKQIKDIKVYNTGGKNPGETKGKLDPKNIHKYKTTNKIFYKNTYKIKESDLAFGIVLDASGSMWGDGIKNGRITMIVLHETLKALGINHSIVTHTSSRHHHCIIRRFQSFKEDKTFKVRKNYALASIKEYNGNCDSAALCYMEKALLKAKNKDKICLIFSDGQPTECSDKELKLQVKDMESKGIKVIGIGVNFPEIKRYYTDYANGKNLKEMLDIVSKILKEYILIKED